MTIFGTLNWGVSGTASGSLDAPLSSSTDRISNAELDCDVGPWSVDMELGQASGVSSIVPEEFSLTSDVGNLAPGVDHHTTNTWV